MRDPSQGGRPIASWMKKVANHRLSDRNLIVDYEYLAEKFGATIQALRMFSARNPYPAHHVPNPKGGTIKKFKFVDFARVVADHVSSYKG